MGALPFGSTLRRPLRSAPMELGVVLTASDIGFDWPALREFVRRSTLPGSRTSPPTTMSSAKPRPGGWRAVHTYDVPIHEPLTLLSFIAASTGLDVVTSVLLLPQRQTVLVAKQAAALDVLRGGGCVSESASGATGWSTRPSRAVHEPRQADRGTGRGAAPAVDRGAVTFDGAGTTSTGSVSTPFRDNVRSRSGWDRSSAISSSRCSSVSVGWLTYGCRSSRPTTTSRPRSTGCAAMPWPPAVTPTSWGSSTSCTSGPTTIRNAGTMTRAPTRALGATHLKVQQTSGAGRHARRSPRLHGAVVRGRPHRVTTRVITF